MKILGPEKADIGACEKIMRALPNHFGIEEALVQYLADIGDRPTFHVYVDGQMAGFLSLTRHSAESAEIHVMGVVPTEQRKGVGSALVDAAADYLQQDGVILFSVKTLGEAHPDENYKRTRAFYRAKGFIPLEEIPNFWNGTMPTLFMVKPLRLPHYID